MSIPKAHNLMFANRSPASSRDMIESAEYEEIPELTLRRFNSSANNYSCKPNESYMTTPLSKGGGGKDDPVTEEGLYDN